MVYISFCLLRHGVRRYYRAGPAEARSTPQTSYIHVLYVIMLHRITYTYVHNYVYVYIYIERERDVCIYIYIYIDLAHP